MPKVNSTFLAKYIGKPCIYCHRPMESEGPYVPTRDHVHPKSAGYKFTLPGNKVICCEKCNVAKKSDNLITWWFRLRNGADPRAPIVFRFIIEYNLRGWHRTHPLARPKAIQAFRQALPKWRPESVSRLGAEEIAISLAATWEFRSLTPIDLTG